MSGGAWHISTPGPMFRARAMARFGVTGLRMTLILEIHTLFNLGGGRMKTIN